MQEFIAPKPKEGEAWDAIIIGSGPAALTASIYTTRGAASTLIIGGENWGGQLMLTTVVDNYPALPGVLGPDLMHKMQHHATLFGGEFIAKNVESVDFNKHPFEIEANNLKYLAKSVIVATGADTIWLGVPGEYQLIGRGVSSCAPCDAPFFRDRKVAVVGGGDSAMEEALTLAKYTSDITVIHRRDSFRASAAMQQKVFAIPSIKIIWNTTVSEIKGTQKLEKLILKNIQTGKLSELDVNGVFIAIGHAPSSKIFSGQVELDEKGYIKKMSNDQLPMTNGYQMATSVPGVFVAGDVHDYHYKQAVTAAGFGCMAAMDTLKYLDRLKD